MIERRRHGPVAELRLAHGKVNAFDLELCDELSAAVEELERDDTGAVVLSAAGRSFSAGVDLKRVLDGGLAYVEAFIPAMIRAFTRILFTPLPVVAAVNGHAIAGGCVLAAAADARIGAAGAYRIGAPELSVGVAFPAVALETLRFACPPPLLDELVVRSKLLAPEDALRGGFLDEIVPPDRLQEAALARAHELAALPPAAFRLQKEQRRRPVRDFLEAHAARIDAAALEHWRQDDTRARIRAAIEKLSAR